MSFYQNGIVRFHLDEHGSPIDRFRASSIDGVEEDQLVAVDNLEDFIDRTGSGLVISGLTSDDGVDSYEWDVDWVPFRVT